MKTSRTIISLSILLAAAANAQVQTEKPPIVLNATQEARFAALLPNLRCLVCQNESLADSQAPLALDLRYEIRSLLAQGDNDMQVKKYLTDRYGEFILYRPVIALHTYLLWFGPLLLLMVGLGAVYRFTRWHSAAISIKPVDREALSKLLEDEAQ